MLDFIVISLPRSGSTWCSNWLNTENSLCLHDATGYMLPDELDNYKTHKEFKGIACTAAWAWKEWIEEHPAKVLILERDIKEINRSLVELGLPPLTDNAVKYFNGIKGLRVQYTDLFNKPKEIWDYLLPELHFDAERHRELVKMNIQPVESVIVPDAEYVKRMLNDLGNRLDQIM